MYAKTLSFMSHNVSCTLPFSGKHFPWLVRVKEASLHCAFLKVQIFPYVLPFDPQTGRLILGHGFTHSSERLTSIDSNDGRCGDLATQDAMTATIRKLQGIMLMLE